MPPVVPPAVWPVALVFCLAGALHFLVPGSYEQIMPRRIPATGLLGRRALVLASGAAELLGGLGTLHPATRVAAGWGLVALLVAVFPANLEMLAAARRRRTAAWAQALLLARLPLQPLMMYWVWAATVRPPIPA